MRKPTSLQRLFSTQVQLYSQSPYVISGSETHTVQIDLSPNTRVKATPSNLIFMSQGVDMETSSFGGISSALGRYLSGAPLMLVQFGYHQSEGQGRIVLGPNFYSKLIPLDLKEFGGTVVCRKDSFVVGPEDTQVDVHVIPSFFSMVGGEGVLLQRISGAGTILIKASGVVQSLYLSPGETQYLHPGSLVAYEDSTVQYSVEPIQGAKNMFFGQGFFLVKVTGPGKVVVQTMSETKFAQSLHLAAGSSLSVLDMVILDSVLHSGGHEQVSETAGESVAQEDPGENVKKGTDEAGGQEEVGEAVKTQETDSSVESGTDPAESSSFDSAGEDDSGLFSGLVDWIKDLFS